MILSNSNELKNLMVEADKFKTFRQDDDTRAMFRNKLCINYRITLWIINFPWLKKSNDFAVISLELGGVHKTSHSLVGPNIWRILRNSEKI
jgi:hypothetical protein